MMETQITQELRKISDNSLYIFVLFVEILFFQKYTYHELHMPNIA